MSRIAQAPDNTAGRPKPTRFVWWSRVDSGTWHAWHWGRTSSRCGLMNSEVGQGWYGTPPLGARACRTCKIWVVQDDLDRRIRCLDQAGRGS